MRRRRASFALSWVGAVALVSGGLLAAPAVGAAPAESAAAATVTCTQLSSGQPCTLRYSDYPGLTTVVIPEGIDEVTVILAGGSGDGGGNYGAPGPGGMVIATIDVSTLNSLDLTLGDEAHDRQGGSGWADGGDGGEWDAGNDGRGGGGASALSYSSNGTELIVAGGGGGGGANVQNIYPAGGGGYGGEPPGNGANGKGEAYGAGGDGGGESGTTGGEGGHDSGNIFVGGGGGGGGGGANGGQGGGWGSYLPQFGYNSPGGGGGGSSSTQDVTSLGTGAAPIGPGFVTFFAGAADRYECSGSNDPETLDIPDGVDEYAVIAVAGAGDPGNSEARGGHGAVVSGIIDVRGLSQLQYWVGCGGGHADGAGFAQGGKGGHAPSPFAKDGGHGGGATAVATGDGEIVLVAGGGGGAGGDIANCDDPPGPRCGGQGGSGGGTPGSRLPANGADGDGGDGGRGGKANDHYHDGAPDPTGDKGVEPGCCDESGGGGGGGGGFPMGGEGGHHDVDAAGGGGGAGGSYINSYWMSAGAIATSGQAATSDDPANGYLLLLPIVIPNVDLTVKKSITGAADEYAQGPFVVSVVCTLDGQNTFTGDLSLDAGGETTVPISQGSTCDLTETQTGGASTPAPPVSVVLDQPTTVVDMLNTFAATTLEVTVASEVVDEDDQPTDTVQLDPGTIRVTVACTLAGHSLTLPDGVLEFDGAATFVAGGASQTLSGLPVGALCSVEQHPGSGASRTEYVLNGIPGGPSTPFPLGASANTADIGNAYDLVPLTITKAKGGTGTLPAGALFDGTVACTFNGAPVGFDTQPAFADLAVDASTTVHNLPAGAICTVTETETAGANAVDYSPGRSVPILPADTEVTITNVFDAGSLLVQVTSSGPGAQWANQVYSLRVECTDPGEPGNPVVFSVVVAAQPGGGSSAFSPDVGWVCSVLQENSVGETSLAYWSSADPTPSADPVQIAIGATQAALYVDDVFDVAPIQVSVAPSGDGLRFADPTTVRIDCTFNGVPAPFFPNGLTQEYHFAPQGGDATTSPMVANAACEVELADTGGASNGSIEVSNGDPSSTTGFVTANVTVQPPGTSVAFDTVFDVAAFDVLAILSGPAAWASNAGFGVDVSCTLDGIPIDQLGPGGTVSLSFEPDGTPVEDHNRSLLDELPVGAVCTLGIGNQGGATTTTFSSSPPYVIATDGTTVTIDFGFAAGGFRVTKAVGGNDGAAHEAGPFAFEVACTFNGLPLGAPPGPPQPRYFTLSDGEFVDFTLLPAGAQCTAAEIIDQDATSVTPDQTQPAAIVADAVLPLLFTNTFDVADVTVAEVITGPGGTTYGDPQTFVATLLCTYPGGEPVWFDDPRVHLDSGNGFSATVEAPVGATCTATQPPQRATSQSVSPPVAILLGDQHAITITSDFQVGALTTSKTALGDFAADYHFAFTTECVFPDPRGADPVPLNDDLPNAFLLESGQHREVEALVDATCTTTETPAPNTLRVDVAASGQGATTSGTGASVVASLTIPADVRVTNYMPGSIPVTGTELAIGIPIGAALVLLGIGVLVFRRFERNPIPRRGPQS